MAAYRKLLAVAAVACLVISCSRYRGSSGDDGDDDDDATTENSYDGGGNSRNSHRSYNSPRQDAENFAAELMECALNNDVRRADRLTQEVTRSYQNSSLEDRVAFCQALLDAMNYYEERNPEVSDFFRSGFRECQGFQIMDEFLRYTRIEGRDKGVWKK